MIQRLQVAGILLAALLLVVITAAVYQEALQNAFHFDDLKNITENRAIQADRINLETLTTVIRESHLPRRILPNISFAVDWLRGGGSPEPFQWTNVAIHCGNAVLVFLLLYMIIGLQRNDTGGTILAGCLTGALIWSLHPIQVQSVTYIVQRMNSMAALFVFLSVLCYLLGRFNPGHRLPWYGACLAAFLLGSISKENAWITPGLLLLTEYGVCRHGRELITGKRDIALVCIPVLLLGWVIIDLASQAGPLYAFIEPTYANRDFTLTERLLTQPRVLVFHISQFLWPLPDRFSIEHDFLASTGLLQPPATFAAILLVFGWCLAGFGCLLYRNSRITGFFLLWVPLTLLIESSIVGLEMAFEHRMYLPLLGLAGLVTQGLMWIASRNVLPRTATATFALIMISSLAAATMIRLPVWRSQLSLVEHAVEVAPDNPRVWNNLGSFHMTEGDPRQAFQAFNRAIDLDPGYALAYLNRGKYYQERRGNPQAALHDFNQALRIRPDLAKAYLERGSLLYQQGNLTASLQDFEQVVRLEPDNHLGYNNRGLVRLNLGHYRQALTDFAMAIRLAPRYQPAYANRGDTYQLLSAWQQALENYDHALALAPADARTRYNRGLVYESLGNDAAAMEDFRIACEAGFERGCRKYNAGSG